MHGKKGVVTIIASVLVFASILLVGLYAGGVFAGDVSADSEIGVESHTSSVTILPTPVKCGDVNEYTLSITNTGNASDDPIYNVRVYNDTNVDHAGFVCGAAPSGWEFKGYSKLNSYCEYETSKNPSNADLINFGETLDFTFSARMTDDCDHEWKTATTDIKEPVGDVVYNSPVVTADCTPPKSEKTYGEPFFSDGVSDWITSDTNIHIEASDDVGPHDTGIEYIAYKYELASDEACRNEKVCDSFIFTKGWEVVYDDSVDFKIKEESCHVIEFKSRDNVGNLETPFNRQCVFVDNSAPSVDKRVDEKAIEDNGEIGVFHWITPGMNVTFTCTDAEPHPVDHSELCFRVSYDEDADGYNTDVYCSKYSGNMEGDECCVNAENAFVFNFNENEDSLHDLEYYCRDELGNEGAEFKQYYKVDSAAPTITKKMFGFYDGQCPPKSESDICYVGGSCTSGVNISVVDKGTCAVDKVECYYEVWWEDKLVDSGEFTNNKEVKFTEDSTHYLNITCYDALGNVVSDREKFLVDLLPPVTTKTYGEPYKVEPKCYNSCSLSCGSDNSCMDQCVHTCVQWISSKTPVTLNAFDEKSGVHKTYWKNTLVESDDACWKPSEYCRVVSNYSDRDWNEYSGKFFKSEESCHRIEYYSVDALGNREEIKVQCVFVDNTAPDVFKDVGEPKLPGDNSSNGESECVYDGRVPEGSGGSITPSELFLSLNPSESHTETKTVSFDETLFGKLDVLFLFDLTGSMGGELAEAKSSATSMMNNISTLVDDAAFGVGSFMDYNNSYSSCDYSSDYGASDDYPWSLDEEITTTTSDVNDAINALSLGSGNDGPESYTRALYESLSVGWREGSRKVVVIFQDNVPHDCNIEDYGCSETTTGKDPGRDGIVNTADDLIWKDVVADLKNMGITVIVIKAGSSCDGVWNHVANETGGMMEELSNTEELPGKIVSLVENITSTIKKLTLEPKPEFEDWFSWQPVEYNSVKAGDDVQFNITVTVPSDAYGGSYHLYLKVMGDGAILAVQEIWINVSGDVCIPSDDGEGVDWWVTQQTPITFTCNDTGKHPVRQESVCYQVLLTDGDETDLTEDYCSHEVNEDGLCCEYVGDSAFTFFFKEDSNHKIKYYCADHLGNKGEEHEQEYKVDTQEPVTTKEYLSPFYRDNEGYDYIDTASRVKLSAKDGGEICAVDDSKTYYDWRRVDDSVCWNRCDLTGVEMTGKWNLYSEPFGIDEESCHVIWYYSVDALGNREKVKNQCVFVDKTKPETTKRYDGVQYSSEGGYPKWINDKTNVILSAEDLGDHPSGVKETKYRVTLVDEKYCADQELCVREASGDGEWSTYLEAFNIREESCHLVEFYSVDNVDKTEDTKKQCVFVDLTAPIPNKTVSLPKSMWDGEDSVFYKDETKHCWDGTEDSIDCWKITMNTTLELGCVDPEPHPVDHEKVCFNVGLDGDDVSENYCSMLGGVFNESGDDYCCLAGTTDEFTFREESEHNLKYYCVDALGNKGEVDEEKFKVMGNMFTIPLNKKWNLISVPFVLSEELVEKVFEGKNDSVEAVWTYDPSHSACGVDWCVYRPGEDTNNLEKIETGKGYWVLATEDDELIVGGSLYLPGPITPPNRELVKGWNLIGYYGTEELEAFEGPNGNGKYSYCALYSLRNLDGWLHPTKWSSLVTYWENDNPEQWKELGLCGKMDPGAGYWIHMDEEGEYAPQTICQEGTVIDKLLDFGCSI